MTSIGDVGTTLHACCQYALATDLLRACDGGGGGGGAGGGGAVGVGPMNSFGCYR